MTWSIVAFDPAAASFGIAVATRAFAVGARCPFVRSKVGAVCTQSISNGNLGPAVLDLLESGMAPVEALEEALRGDEGRHLRQIHAVDRHGRSAAWTGQNCVEWAGDRTGDGFSVAGNMLAGEPVVRTTFDSFATGDGTLAERLMAALEAGQQAGGDKRGKQSAALIVTSTEDFPDINLRVDDSPDPLPELRRLLSIYRRDVEPRSWIYPTKAKPSGETDLDVIEADWKARGLNLRFRR